MLPREAPKVLSKWRGSGQASYPTQRPAHIRRRTQRLLPPWPSFDRTATPALVLATAPNPTQPYPSCTASPPTVLFFSFIASRVRGLGIFQGGGSNVARPGA